MLYCEWIKVNSKKIFAEEQRTGKETIMPHHLTSFILYRNVMDNSWTPGESRLGIGGNDKSKDWEPNIDPVTHFRKSLTTRDKYHIASGASGLHHHHASLQVEWFESLNQNKLTHHAHLLAISKLTWIFIVGDVKIWPVLGIESWIKL